MRSPYLLLTNKNSIIPLKNIISPLIDDQWELCISCRPMRTLQLLLTKLRSPSLICQWEHSISCWTMRSLHLFLTNENLQTIADRWEPLLPRISLYLILLWSFSKVCTMYIQYTVNNIIIYNKNMNIQGSIAIS